MCLLLIVAGDQKDLSKSALPITLEMHTTWAGKRQPTTTQQKQYTKKGVAVSGCHPTDAIGIWHFEVFENLNKHKELQYMIRRRCMLGNLEMGNKTFLLLFIYLFRPPWIWKNTILNKNILLFCSFAEAAWTLMVTASFPSVDIQIVVVILYSSSDESKSMPKARKSARFLLLCPVFLHKLFAVRTQTYICQTVYQ